jgi:HlyD family secretion protein
MMRIARAALPIAILALVGCAEGERTPAGLGTLEVVEVDVAPILPGRVMSVRVEEGDAVRTGDTLVVLTQSTVGADIEGRRAMVAAAEARLRDLEAGARPAELQRARAEVAAAEAEAERARRDMDRLVALAADGHVTEQQLDLGRSAARTAEARRDAARQVLRLLDEGSRPEQIRAARAEVENSRAALAAVENAAGDLVLTAPVDGQVLARHVEAGEILTPGEAALTLGVMDRPWVRVYLGPDVLPAVAIGDAATGTLDALPGRTFAGRVTAINPRAEFTPRVALTEDERADLLFGVRVDFDDAQGMLKPGLPITVRFPEAGARLANDQP